LELAVFDDIDDLGTRIFDAGIATPSLSNYVLMVVPIQSPFKTLNGLQQPHQGFGKSTFNVPTFFHIFHTNSSHITLNDRVINH
jgi:hypothetical protein